MKILICDSVSEQGIEILRQQAEVDVKTGLKEDELVAIIGDYDAIMVRSQTRVTDKVIQAGKKLQVIARAGAGVDTIDVEEATRHGVVVVNAPRGNTISAAEHTIALMLALSRHIPQANAKLKSGVWQRSEFMGTEVRDKTLGIIGLGNIGSEVAKRARGLEMKLIGHDPFVSIEHAKNLQIKIVSLEELFKVSDYITIHVPANAQTRGIIGQKELAMMKPTVRIINCARGGLIDEEALARMVKEKKVAGAAVDVFSKEPATESVLFESDSIIVTPHLGASTTEAQMEAAKVVSEQIIDILNGAPARYAVNAPFIAVETLSVLAPFVKVANILGKLVSQLAEGQTNSFKITYEGEISGYDTNALLAAALGGLLESVSEERVNLVNANLLAAQRGLAVVEQKEAACENYTSLITVEVATSTGVTTVAGTVMHQEPHFVRVNEYWLDIQPTSPYFLFSDHRDRPGLVGAVGKITGDADINISSMHLGRLQARGEALMVFALDEALPEEHRQKILALPDVHNARLVKL